MFTDKWHFSQLPLKDAIDAYVHEHKPIGGFLTALLANDLREAAAHADAQNSELLATYGMYLGELPRACHGSYEAVEAWAPGSG